MLERLSVQETITAHCIAEGLRDKQIIWILRVSRRRLRQIVATIAEKLDVDPDRDTRVQITRIVLGAPAKTVVPPDLLRM